MKKLKIILPLIFVFVITACGSSICKAAPLDGERWKEHYVNDIMPYWTDKSALGDPAGNFPSRRDMNGKAAGDVRYTRMIARQVYAYLIGFNLTGDETLLEYAMDGINWILGKAKDPGKGYFAKLDGRGRPDRKLFKSAQDQAYVMLAFSSFFYITRDQTAKKELDENINLLFNGVFWDTKENTMIDARSGDLAKAVEFENPGHDIVTILDQANAYLLLYVNNLEGADRDVNLKYLKKCGDILAEKFFKDGIFWDTDSNRKNYNAKHLDAGHVLKTYWMLYEIARVWKVSHNEELYKGILDKYLIDIVLAAYSEKYGMWGKKFKNSYKNIICANPDWWMQIECNQLAARLLNNDKRIPGILEKTTEFWFGSDFIDKTRKIRGIRESVKLDGSFMKNGDKLTAKAHEWKNGYHESEQAIMLYLLLNSFNKKSSTLYYATESDKVKNFAANPYVFNGKVISLKEDGYILNKKYVRLKAVFEDIN